MTDSESVDPQELIKQQIALALKEPSIDYSKIIQLSSELASFDNANVRFSVDAGLINRLGKELVGRPETALSELVKNGYDADATTVEITFIKSDKVGGSLQVKDNGNGMTRDQLINGFMRISSSDKIHYPKSPLFKRTRAGRKGIGRFATQRLGHQLTVFTQTAESTECLKVTIDWDRFANDSDLISVSNKIENVPLRPQKGTILIIRHLREAWSDAAIRRVYRYVSELLQPFPLSNQLPVSTLDLGFKATFFRKDEQGRKHTVINEQKAFYDQALAQIEGAVDENGIGYWSVMSNRLNFDQTNQRLSKDGEPYKYLKNVHLKAYYYIFESGLMPAQQLSSLREVLREQGGIRIYRNGFRVLPYGEQDVDWTGLDASVRRRVILPPHGNNSFLGFVEIIDSEGILFDETASREGLLENSAFNELSDFTYRVLIGAVLSVAQARFRKGTAGQKRIETNITPTEIISNSATQVIDILGRLRNDIIEKPKTDLSEKPRDTNNTIKTNLEDVTKIEESLKAILDANNEQQQEKNLLIKEINQLRVLAGIGLVIGQFIHEIKTYVTSFELDLQELVRLLAGNEAALRILEMLRSNLESFVTYRSYFERIISENISRELSSIELRQVVNPFITTIEPDMRRSDIVMHSPIFEDYGLYTIPMHRSEWASILFNFYSNAKKAIYRAGSQGEMFIQCGKTRDIVFLEFSDNGDGISPEVEDKIFDAFYTTSQPTSRNATYQDELLGLGLGLKIVKDIVESYQGKVYVTSPKAGYNTTIRIEVPIYKKITK